MQTSASNNKNRFINNVLLIPHRMSEPLSILFTLSFNFLSPHDAIKHHFTSLKTDLIFLQVGVLE